MKVEKQAKNLKRGVEMETVEYTKNCKKGKKEGSVWCCMSSGRRLKEYQERKIGLGH